MRHEGVAVLGLKRLYCVSGVICKDVKGISASLSNHAVPLSESQSPLTASPEYQWELLYFCLMQSFTQTLIYSIFTVHVYPHVAQHCLYVLYLNHISIYTVIKSCVICRFLVKKKQKSINEHEFLPKILMILIWLFKYSCKVSFTVFKAFLFYFSTWFSIDI